MHRTLPPPPPHTHTKSLTVATKHMGSPCGVLCGAAPVLSTLICCLLSSSVRSYSAVADGEIGRAERKAWITSSTDKLCLKLAQPLVVIVVHDSNLRRAGVALTDYQSTAAKQVHTHTSAPMSAVGYERIINIHKHKCTTLTVATYT